MTNLNQNRASWQNVHELAKVAISGVRGPWPFLVVASEATARASAAPHVSGAVALEGQDPDGNHGDNRRVQK